MEGKPYQHPNQSPSKQQPAALNALVEISNPELAKWYHTALFIPVKKNLLQAIKNGHFTTWPNLKVELMNHLPPSMATTKGHMKQIRKNIKSTKTQDTPPDEEKTMEILETRSNQVFANIINPRQRIATGLTGRFPVTSNRGNTYLFIIYEYDSNIILVRPIKNRAEK